MQGERPATAIVVLPPAGALVAGWVLLSAARVLMPTNSRLAKAGQPQSTALELPWVDAAAGSWL